MVTPESVVYRGREGTGIAQVFGRPGDPMGTYNRRRIEDQHRQAVQAEQTRLAKADRDKKMWEMINIDPEKAFEPFNQQVKTAAEGHRDKIVQYFERGGNPEDPRFRADVKKGWDDVNSLAIKSNHIKNVITQTQQSIKDNPYLQQEYYFPKMWDMYLDEKGNGKPLSDIDYSSIQNIHVNDPLGFNESKYQKDYMEGLNDNVSNFVTQKAQNNGILTQGGETKWKGNVYTPDPNSPIGVKVDANGQPILNVSPEVVNSFLHSDNAKRYYETIAKEQGVDIRDIVKDRVSGIQVKATPSFSRNPVAWQDYFAANRWGLKPNQIPAATDRFNKIVAVQNGVGEDGKVSQKAQAAVGALRGSKFGDGDILEAKIIPGNSAPGKAEAFPGVKIDNAPFPRAVFKVKYSDRGQAKAESVNLADPAAFETLNGLWESSPAEGKQTFSTDQLLGIAGVKPGTTYRGSAAAEKRAAEVQVEQEKLTNLTAGEDYGQLAGKKLNGSPIVSVTKDASLFGNFKGYKIKTADGKETVIAKDDVKTLTDIVRDNGHSSDGETVNVIHPDGRKGSIPKSKLDAAIKAGFKPAN